MPELHLQFQDCPGTTTQLLWPLLSEYLSYTGSPGTTHHPIPTPLGPQDSMATTITPVHGHKNWTSHWGGAHTWFGRILQFGNSSLILKGKTVYPPQFFPLLLRGKTVYPHTICSVIIKGCTRKQYVPLLLRGKTVYPHTAFPLLTQVISAILSVYVT